jgi:hypothetical protein
MQKTRNIVFDALINGKQVSNNSQYAKEAIQDFTDIAIMEQFGRSYQHLLEVPLHLYETVVLIMNKQNAKNKADLEEIQKRSKRR